MDADDGVPLVSVVMPIFNAAAFLDTSVPSILRQSLADLELIAVDDGSSDNGFDRMQAYRTADPRIRLVRQANAGVAAALNHGCSLARGRYIARMDADDIARPDRLARQVAFLERHPDIAVLGSAVTLIDAGGLVTGRRRFPTRPEAIARAIRGGTNAIAHPSVVMRRAAFVASGGYDRRFERSEDYELWLRMLDRFRFANLGVPLLRYRVHAASVSEDGRLHQALARTVALAAHRRAPPATTPDVPIDWAHLDRLGLDACDRVALAIALASVAMRQAQRTDGSSSGAPAEAAAALGIVASPIGPLAIGEAALVRVAVARRRDAGASRLMLSLARRTAADRQARRAAGWCGRAVMADPLYGLGLVAAVFRFVGRRSLRLLSRRGVPAAAPKGLR